MKLKPWLIIVLLGVTVINITACGKMEDTTVKADLATKAKAELDFVGVRFTIYNGIVTLNGECPTLKTRDKVFTTVKKLYGVKGVISNIRIAPVVIGTDILLKQAVDSVLKKYPQVEAITKDSVVILKGKLEGSRMSHLNDEVMSLQPKKLEQQIEIF